ncbi:hydrogenase 1, b-type cytochrome subunit [Candidatus Terasakiella magnetica]|nr:hydrogenase 1, b-type cytochrome subunit [Candidatus Terasakiella magnetica]
MAYRQLAAHGTLPPERIFDWPCRVWHWASAFLVVVLSVSGYLIGTPLPSSSGDTSTLYVMGWLRFAHLAAGQLFALAFLFRTYWAFIGNQYSWQLFAPTFWRKSWSDGFMAQVKWNLMIQNSAPRYVGLNPVANVIMLFMFVAPSILTILTGFAMLAEVTGHDSWQYFCFGWMVSIFGNTLDLHLFHRLCLWVLVCFTISHIYIAIREDITGRQTMVSTMLSGIRQYRR